MNDPTSVLLWGLPILVAAGVVGVVGAFLRGSERMSPLRATLLVGALDVGLLTLVLGLIGFGYWPVPATLAVVPAALAYFVRARPIGDGTPDSPPVREGGNRSRRVTVRALEWTLLLSLVVFGDLLLGLTFEAPGSVFPSPSGSSTFGLLVGAVLSPGFLVAASVEMLGFAFAVRKELDRRILTLLVGQAALVLLTPTMLSAGAWDAVSAFAGAAVMVGMSISVFQYIYRTKQIPASTSTFLVRWTFVAMATAAGWFLWRMDATPVGLGVAVLLEMLLVFSVVVAGPRDEREPRVPWLLHPFWVFEILLFTFVGEFFLGALLDLQVAGRGFLQYIPFVTTSGSVASAAGSMVYDGLWFAAAIMASAWFLVVIGCTMGALVVFKMRESHARPQRYRLGLMLGVYALAAVYLPSLASSTPLFTAPALANLPVIGWGFGLRSGGPFESGVFLAILIMYASVGVLTVLFGRKALCSVMCGAALMYQGTTINEMRQFNQTSRVGRYFLGSQLSTAYTVASSLALVSLFGVSLLAFLHRLPTVQVANGEFDTSALPLPIEIYFGALWFAMFVSVPYVGTYNCATTGFCHWGALSLPFAKVGLYRLKVKDRSVCQRCTTFDCARACPVGLVDMPQFFRTTGEFRSTKCCGVGNCITACPYGNMYEQDIRWWLRRHLTHRAANPRGTPLPMLSPRNTAVAAPTERVPPT
jgi:polyferredoxin